MPSHFLKPLLWLRSRFEAYSTKEMGKKHGKGTVKSGNGFVSVDTKAVWDSSIVKTLAAVTENGAVSSGANC